MIQKALILTLILTFNSLYSQSGQVFYEAISKKYPETKENKADAYIAELENTKILLELKFNNTVSYCVRPQGGFRLENSPVESLR